MIRIQTSGLVAALAVSMMFSAATAQAEKIKFTSAITGTAEVPPNDSAATGIAEATLDTEAKTVTWTYTHDGLSGDMTAAHIHGPATATEAVGLVVDTMTDTMAGSATITDAQAADLTSGMYFFNIHTAKFPNGEIRGQLVVAKQISAIQHAPPVSWRVLATWGVFADRCRRNLIGFRCV